MISPPQNLHKTFIKSYMLKQILHCQTRSDTMRATLARCFVSYHSFLFVLWRISQSLVTYLTRSLQGEKNRKSGPHKAGYWRSGDHASRLQRRKKPCHRDKQLGKSFDLCTLLSNFLITFVNMNFDLNYITASNLIQLTPFWYPSV